MGSEGGRLVGDDGRDGVAGELLPAVEEREFDQERDRDNLGAKFVEQADRGGGGAPGGEKVIDQEDLLAGVNRVLVDLGHRFPILEAVGSLLGGPGKLALLPDRDESALEAVRNRRREDEAPGVDPDDLGDLGVPGGFGEKADRGLKVLRILQNGRDVLEDDARTGKIGDIPDGGAEIVGVRHAAL